MPYKNPQDKKKWRDRNREKNKAISAAWRVAYPERANKHKTEWAKANPEKVKEAVRTWRRNNPDKVLNEVHKRIARKRGNGGAHTSKQWLSLKLRYGNKCLCCGRVESALWLFGLLLVRDHIVSLAKGGTNNIENIQPLCHGTGGCNNHKGAKSIEYCDEENAWQTKEM